MSIKRLKDVNESIRLSYLGMCVCCIINQSAKQETRVASFIIGYIMGDTACKIKSQSKGFKLEL